MNDRKRNRAAISDTHAGETPIEVDNSNGLDGGEAPTLTKLPDCDPGSGDIVERTGADIVADLLTVKSQASCLQAKWDALADELGKRAKFHNQTRVPVRVGGTVYKIKLTEKSKTYSLVEAVEPGEIK
jgi:hypothetical protein